MKEGWEVKKLGEVCDLYQPQTISTKDLVPDGLYDVFGANGIIGKHDKYNHEFPEILMTCRGATCGNINISTPQAWINGNAMVIHIKDGKEIDFNFLKHQLSFIDKTDIITGSAQPQITRQTLSPVSISYPPLPEQERIVSILDAEFAKIDAVKAGAEKSLQHAKDLFQAALKKELTPKEGWETKKLREIGKTQTGTTPSTSDKGNYGSYLPFIKPADINIDGLGNLNYENEGLSEQGASIGRMFASDSVLMVCIGATIGKVGYSIKPTSCNQQINVLTPSEGYICKYLYYYMASPIFQYEVKKEGESAKATLPIINKTKWENLTISYPNLQLQQSIVARLDTLNTHCKTLQANYERTIALCDDMKQALLRKAFNGEL